MRILPLIANNVIVVGESSDDNFCDKNLIRVVIFFKSTNFTHQILSLRDMIKKQVMFQTEFYKDYLKRNFDYLDFVKEGKVLLT